VEANLGQDSPVDVTLVDGRLVITPVVEPPDALEALLDGITEENRHQELQTSSPAGDEAW
jgi:antitoxin MazE